MERDAAPAGVLTQARTRAAPGLRPPGHYEPAARSSLTGRPICLLRSAARSRVTVQSGRERSRGGAPGGVRARPRRAPRLMSAELDAPSGAPPPLALRYAGIEKRTQISGAPRREHEVICPIRLKMNDPITHAIDTAHARRSVPTLPWRGRVGEASRMRCEPGWGDLQLKEFHPTPPRFARRPSPSRACARARASAARVGGSQRRASRERRSMRPASRVWAAAALWRNFGTIARSNPPGRPSPHRRLFVGRPLARMSRP